MTCREFVEHLADHLSGELREALRQQAQAHLLECPDCRHYQLSYEIIVRLTREAFDEPDDVLPDGPRPGAGPPLVSREAVPPPSDADASP